MQDTTAARTDCRPGLLPGAVRRRPTAQQAARAGQPISEAPSQVRLGVAAVDSAHVVVDPAAAVEGQGVAAVDSAHVAVDPAAAVEGQAVAAVH